MTNSTIYTICTVSYGYSAFINNKQIVMHEGASSDSALKYMNNLDSTDIENSFYFATLTRNNNYIKDVTPSVPITDYPIIAYNKNGYLYLIYGRDSLGITKIAKGGQFVTAYLQTDKSVTIYVNKNYNTYKYKATPISNTHTYSIEYISKITNCDCVYEINNNKIVKHTLEGWLIQ